MSAKLKLVAAAGVLVVAAAAGAVLAGERLGAEPDIEAVRAANVGSAQSLGDELLALLATGRQQTMHTRYAVRSNDEEIAAGVFQIHQWRKPPRVRLDSMSNLEGRMVRTSAFRDSDGGPVTQCMNAAPEPWSCSVASGAGAAEFDSLIATVRGELRGNMVAEFAPANPGRNTRCFRIESLQPIEICVTGQGVPTLISSGDARLELLEISQNVKDADFERPAPVG